MREANTRSGLSNEYRMSVLRSFRYDRTERCRR